MGHGIQCPSLSQAATAKKIAQEYNQGLEAAKAAVQEHNATLAAKFIEAGVSKKFIQQSLLPEPQRCPEDLNMAFVRRYLRAFNWKKTQRNTSGSYLAFRQQQDLLVCFQPSFV